MKELKVGVIGAGGRFIHSHLPAYVKIPEARLVAIADPSDIALKRVMREIKNVFPREIEKLRSNGFDNMAERLRNIMTSIKIYKDYREMLEKEDLDLVDICTPHKFHKPIAINSLKSGANVMVEKPMSRTYIEALEIVETVKETGKMFQVNEDYVFAGGFYQFHKLVEANIIGEPGYLIVPCSHSGPEGKEWFWSPEIGGGGSLLDLGSHAINVAWFLIGFDKKPVLVKAEKFTGITIKSRFRYIAGMFREINVEDDAHVLIKFENERNGSWTTALIEASWSGCEYECTMMFGSKGILKVKGAGEKAIIDHIDYLGSRKTIEVSQKLIFENTAICEISNMCKCIINGRKSFLNEKIGAEVMAIIDSAYYSEINGRKTITLDEFKQFAVKLIEKYGEKASDEFIKMKVNHFASSK